MTRSGQALLGDAGSGYDAGRMSKPDCDAATRAAIRFLRKDARWAAIIARVGPYAPAITPDPFHALVGSIVHQQVSMSAAKAIHGRLRALCPRRRVTPSAVLALGDESLRGAGLSRPKVAYIRGLAEAFASRRLTARKLRAASDEEVVAAVTELKGIGRWTAEMLLLFCLQRPDVWPVDDLGLRKAAGRLLECEGMPAASALHDLGEACRPYRSYATWYLWRSLDHAIQPGIAL
jgi:DNA-3-methyladenine glycosylase II